MMEADKPGEPTGEQPVPSDHRGLRVLDLDECLRRVVAAPVGRIAFAHDGEIVVLPVNHTLDGMDVVYRTSWGAKLQMAIRNARVGFEVDGYDESLQRGWSVLIQGTATVVDDTQDERRLESLGLRSWPQVATKLRDADTFWVRVRASEVAGREILWTPGSEANRR